MKVKMYLPLMLLASGISLLGAAPVAETAKSKETTSMSRRAKRVSRRQARQRDRHGRFKSAKGHSNAALKEKINASQAKSLQEVLANVSGGGLQAVHGVIADHIKKLAKKEDLTVGQVLSIARALEREAAIAQALAKRFTAADERVTAYDHIANEYKDAQRIVLPYVATVPAARNIHNRLERRLQVLEGAKSGKKHSFKERFKEARKARQVKRSHRREKRGDVVAKRRSERKERRKARHHKRTERKHKNKPVASDKAQAPVAQA